MVFGELLIAGVARILVGCYNVDSNTSLVPGLVIAVLNRYARRDTCRSFDRLTTWWP